MQKELKIHTMAGRDSDPEYLRWHPERRTVSLRRIPAAQHVADLTGRDGWTVLQALRAVSRHSPAVFSGNGVRVTASTGHTFGIFTMTTKVGA